MEKEDEEGWRRRVRRMMSDEGGMEEVEEVMEGRRKDGEGG